MPKTTLFTAQIHTSSTTPLPEHATTTTLIRHPTITVVTPHTKTFIESTTDTPYTIHISHRKQPSMNPENVYVCDVLVDGRKVRCVYLRNGDEVQVGGFAFGAVGSGDGGDKLPDTTGDAVGTIEINVYFGMFFTREDGGDVKDEDGRIKEPRKKVRGTTDVAQHPVDVSLPSLEEKKNVTVSHMTRFFPSPEDEAKYAEAMVEITVPEPRAMFTFIYKSRVLLEALGHLPILATPAPQKEPISLLSSDSDSEDESPPPPKRLKISPFSPPPVIMTSNYYDLLRERMRKKVANVQDEEVIVIEGGRLMSEWRQL